MSYFELEYYEFPAIMLMFTFTEHPGKSHVVRLKTAVTSLLLHDIQISRHYDVIVKAKNNVGVSRSAVKTAFILSQNGEY